MGVSVFFQCDWKRRIGTSAYLALLHGVTEESVKQQVLQLSILVKRLFDFPQEDTEGQGRTWIAGGGEGNKESTLHLCGRRVILLDIGRMHCGRTLNQFVFLSFK